ncbi:BON domain-containing protein [Pigmentiphaga soli]|uniref:BON domain-containing protein n=1 Tax=Pigmentiphaga soli TaxID=1007095 RepID=A0ABP8HR62_9BURK
MSFRNLIVAGIIGTSAIALAGCESTRNHESAGEYTSDAAITAKVKAAYVSDKTVSATDVNVETYRGTVQLSGFVDNSAQISRAVEIARNIEGVKSVKNDLRLKSSR